MMKPRLATLYRCKTTKGRAETTAVGRFRQGLLGWLHVFRGFPNADAKRGTFGIRPRMLTAGPSTTDRRFGALGITP
jgi:hypothetical protein